MTDRRAPGTATGQGHGEPNPAHPTGQERDNWAGQPLPRHRPTTANFTSNGELLADIGQHGRRQNRQQFLDQLTTTGARSEQRGGDWVAVVAAEDARDVLVAGFGSDLVHAAPAVEQAAGALLGDVGFELA